MSRELIEFSFTTYFEVGWLMSCWITLKSILAICTNPFIAAFIKAIFFDFSWVSQVVVVLLCLDVSCTVCHILCLLFSCTSKSLFACESYLGSLNASRAVTNLVEFAIEGNSSIRIVSSIFLDLFEFLLPCSDFSILCKSLQRLVRSIYLGKVCLSLLNILLITSNILVVTVHFFEKSLLFCKQIRQSIIVIFLLVFQFFLKCSQLLLLSVSKDSLCSLDFTENVLKLLL